MLCGNADGCCARTDEVVVYIVTVALGDTEEEDAQTPGKRD